MNLARIFRSLRTTGSRKAPAQDRFLDGGRRSGESNNPYLSARRTWNDHAAQAASSRQAWQLLAVLSLLVALAAVGGMVHVASQSR